MLKLVGDSHIVTCPIIELYLPYEYAAAGLYEIVGDNVKYYGIANFKCFKNEKEIEHRELVDTIPLGISSFIIAHPTEKLVEDVQFVKGGIYRKCIVLRFFQNDKFVVNRNIIKNVDNMAIISNLLESGKLDNIPPEIVADVVIYAQELNNINLKLPEELIEMMAAERYRDPTHPSRKARFIDNRSVKNDKHLTVTPREESMMSTTFQGFSFEDISTSLVAATNRKNDGIYDKETTIEQIVKGKK